MVRMERIEEARPQAPTKPDPVGYIPSRSRGMKMSQLFFSRSKSSGGLLYSTVTSRWSCLRSHTDMTGKATLAGAAGEDKGVLGLEEGEDLAAL